ncbi:hypothetical protein QTN47_07680 [Danxiaibacter flavus]|uniref:Methyltransferase type 11 domain-containing protein n=1 Tax=Danxiaibacter flavus TaxID=3049108 RepID=A0ABV3ZBX3_9BACT|nr:hypothetical protein QNM32_07680 [Chitinophagaceae bacterium DXS]
MKNTVLFVSHANLQCGVHEFGNNIGNALSKSTLNRFVYVECSNMGDLNSAIAEHSPIAIIYNYHPSTLPWVTKNAIRNIPVPQIGIVHEVTQEIADNLTNKLFDYHIAADPTLLLKNPIVFKTGRLVPGYENKFALPEVPVIGSFGFATPNKGFEDIVKGVQHEFDEAVIRFNIPSADFGDKDGSKARELVEKCKAIITKPGIKLVVTHDFLSQAGILDFLAQNSINVFLYQDKFGRGLSSTVDYALAVGRPLAISDSLMFRHLHSLEPSIVYGEKGIKEIMNQDASGLAELKRNWDAENLIWEYNRIIASVLQKEEAKKFQPEVSGFKKFKTAVRAALGLQQKNFSWLRNTKAASEDTMSVDSSFSYHPIKLNGDEPLNRILDNKARQLYSPAIDALTNLVPLTMAKKIAEANVQQAFVFDTVYRFIQEYSSPKILCVGSYEDTAAMSLKRMGYKIEDIDPVLNYFLQEYYTKPTTIHQSYDIVFSTSVIEHDPDDESFIDCINGLLKPGGVAVITCDYKDQWKPGDLKPEVDARLYTQKDLKERLLPLMTGCELVGEPQWDCPNPDFNYLGKYQYTFATFVVRKNK